MKCTDIHNQDDYNAHKDDKNACLHIRGSVGWVASGGRVDRIASGGRVGWVDSGGSVGTVASGGSVGWVASGGSVGTVASGGSVGTVASGGSVGWVASGGRVDRIASGGSVGTVASGGSVGWVASGGRVDRIASGGRVGWVDSGGSVGTVASGGSVGWVDSGGSVGTVASGGSVGWVASGGSVHAYGGTIKAGPAAVIFQHGGAADITGGIVVKAPDYTQMSPAQWAEHSGVSHDQETGLLTVYKAVDSDLVSGHGTKYLVGAEVTAPDWDPVAECGRGLHFSPRPVVAASYMDGRARRFLECEVSVADTVVLDATKVKARSCRVLCEVGAYGDPAAVRTEIADVWPSAEAAPKGKP